MSAAAPADTSVDGGGRSTALVVVLGALTAIGPLSGDAYLPAFPAIADDLGVRQVDVQLTLTASLLGLSIGQLLAGPLSDRHGRRAPLLLGAVGYTLASLGCAVAPTVHVLIGLRLLQGLAGAVGIVVARAVVRDLYTGAAAAAFFSRLLLVFALAPILAPFLGAGMLAIGNWRAIFLALALAGALLVLSVARLVPETLPVGRRTTGGLRGALRPIRAMLCSPRFMGYVVASGAVFAGMFGYLASYPFIVQGLHGRSPAEFSLLFAVNATGLLVVGQVNRRLVGTVPPRRMLAYGLGGYATGGALMLVAALHDARGATPLAAVALAAFVVISSLGFVLPNATALALDEFPQAAGTASALFGATQFLLGAVAAPLVGLGPPGTVLPLATVLVVAAASSLVAMQTAGRSQPTCPRSG
jgi:DHA1 family bicyclomycin/chloramphenicol resistance-like MFS transporter